MENTPNNQVEKTSVPYEYSFEVATKLLKQYNRELALADNDNFGNRNTPEIIYELPEEITERFYGHGITKAGPNCTHADTLAAFINILDNNAVKGYYGPLSGGQFGAYANSDFLLISHCDTELGILETGIENGNKLVQNEIGWEGNIGAYVVSNKYYPIIEELRKLYPDKNIIKADEVPQYLAQEIAKKPLPEKQEYTPLHHSSP